jgi:predicted negative regulator of RcsB-dependent stress response
MVKKDKDLNPAEKPEVLQDSISKTELLLEDNKKLISNVLIGIGVLIALIFGYKNWFSEPAEKAGFESIWMAQKYFEQDSILKAIPEFEYVAEEHEGTKAGNLANLYLGLTLIKDSQFDEALASFENFDASGELFPGLKLGLIGDCHSELGNITEAVTNYKQAAKLLDAKSVSPYYLKKAGILLEQNDDLDGAVKIYELAVNSYLKDAPPSLQNVKNEMKKLLARANASK